MKLRRQKSAVKWMLMRSVYDVCRWMWDLILWEKPTLWGWFKVVQFSTIDVIFPHFASSHPSRLQELSKGQRFDIEYAYEFIMQIVPS